MTAIALSLCGPPALADDQAAPPPADNQQLLHKYVLSTLGPSGMVHSTLVAGFDQWRHAPHVWDQDGKGYAKRWASDFAESAIGSTAKYTLARLSHQDPSFTRCQCSGWRRRLRHAVTAPFTARRRDGSETFSLATTTGMVAEHVIPAMTWYPTHRGARNGLLHAATSISAKIGIDTFREFVRFD